MSTPQFKISPEHLQSLYQITRTITSSLDFNEVLNLIMDSVMQITKAQRGFLMTADAEGHWQVRVARGIDREQNQMDTPYSTTIVNHVVATREALLTNNAQFDERYRAGESIIMRGLRAILCAPMLVQDRLVGVLYVDTSMRAGSFSESDLELLRAVAGQAGIAIENARLYAVAVEKGRMERELQMAREIQESLLPRRMPIIQGYELAAQWRSAREVAGDFYDVFQLPDGQFGLVVADVSDKGAPAALFMASTRSVIRSQAFSGCNAFDTLYRTNDLILGDAESGMFVTVLYGVFSLKGQAAIVNAGHNPPIIWRQRLGKGEFLTRGGRALGWFPANPLGLTELQLEPGDAMIFYTDGLTDAENAAGEPFGADRLVGAVNVVGNQSAEIILDYIIAQVERFCGEIPVFDDVTLAVVRYTGS
ncbi:MAG: SpoIIE family protein phosphatase [Anaerolinea sp.]|nr:SpoIIE family protein phosphatase [Anaerolinea sp.]